MLESEFQNKLIQELKRMFKGCIVTKLDASHIQGIPDLLILYNDKWATLECKKSVRAKKQPNQEYYVGRMNEMSFSRFICPENKEESPLARPSSYALNSEIELLHIEQSDRQPPRSLKILPYQKAAG